MLMIPANICMGSPESQCKGLSPMTLRAKVSCRCFLITGVGWGHADTSRPFNPTLTWAALFLNLLRGRQVNLCCKKGLMIVKISEDNPDLRAPSALTAVVVRVYQYSLCLHAVSSHTVHPAAAGPAPALLLPPCVGTAGTDAALLSSQQCWRCTPCWFRKQDRNFGTLATLPHNFIFMKRNKILSIFWSTTCYLELSLFSVLSEH